MLLSLNLKELKLVRIAVSADYPAILEVFYSAKEALKLIGIDQWQLGVPQPENFAADIAAGRGLVCEIEGRIAAYCALSDTPSKFYPLIAGPGWSFPQASYLVINRLAVHQDFTRQGLARKLIHYALDRAQHLNNKSVADDPSPNGPWHVRLDTHPGNIRMHQLLKELGFNFTGTVNYPMPGETKRFCYEGLVSNATLPTVDVASS